MHVCSCDVLLLLKEAHSVICVYKCIYALLLCVHSGSKLGHMCVYIFICMCTCIYVCVHIYNIYVCVHVYVCVYIYVCVCTYTYMCVNIYVCAFVVCA